jgi:hypothetical protein
MIRDRDGKFPALFDTVLADTGIQVVLTGVQMPRMNSIIERWIQTCLLHESERSPNCARPDSIVKHRLICC